MLIVCEAVPTASPQCEVTGLQWTTIKGNVQFLPRKQHYLHFGQKKIESFFFFFFLSKRIIALYVKAEPRRCRGEGKTPTGAEFLSRD